MAIFYGRSGRSDIFVGASGVADIFRFKPLDLGPSDVLIGGGGHAVDTLDLLKSGTVSAAALANVSDIERILLADGANAITLTDALVGSASGKLLVVIGGKGDDRIDGSAVVTPEHRLDLTAGSGRDTLLGGAGADTFRFEADHLTASDQVDGGGSEDRLIFSRAGRVSAWDLAAVSAIERIELARGHNELSLTDALVASATGALLTVIGDSGNDEVDGSRINETGNRLDLTAGSGNDTLTGGRGADIFRFEANALSGSDRVTGGDGPAEDVLAFSKAGSVSASDLARVIGIERIELAAGSNQLVLGNTLLWSSQAQLLTILGASGNDHVDGSNVSKSTYWLDITAGGGSDRLVGGSGADTFRFAESALTSSDTVQGGGGSAIDRLVLSTAGQLTSSDLSKVSGIERIELADGANRLAIGNALVSSAAGQRLQVVGGAGDDQVDGSAVNQSKYRLDLTAGGGNDRLTGGKGDDIFRIAALELDAIDVIRGGDGIDTLQLLTPGTLAAAALAGISGIELILLADGANAIAVDDRLAAAARGGVLAVLGGSGADEINGSDVAAPRRLVLNGGGGDDIIAGGAGFDTLNGGSGDDRIVYDPGDHRIDGGTGFDTLVLLAAADIDINATGDQSSGDQAYVTGFEDVDASALDTGLLIIGDDTGNSLVGSSGDDRIEGRGGDDEIEGLLGADTLLGDEGDDLFLLGTGDVAAGESIDGGIGDDTIRVDGVVDLRPATLAGIEHLRVETASEARISAGQAFQFAILTAAPATGATLVIDVGSGATANFNPLVLSGFDSITINGAGGGETIAGTSLQDSIFGLGGDDRIVVEGEDVVDGGTGDDTMVLLQGSQFFDLSADDQNGTAAVATGFENIDASAAPFSLSMTGDGGANRLTGGAGNDFIRGGIGADTLSGQGGDDTVTYDALDVSADGGSGFDTLVVLGAAEIDLSTADQSVGDNAVVTNFETVDASASTVSVTLTSGDDPLSALIGGSAGDVLTAGANGTPITGGGGADTMFGAAGDDLFLIAAGDIAAGETIDGGGGSDTLRVTSFGVDLAGLSFVDVETFSLGSNSSVTMTAEQALGFATLRGSAPSHLGSRFDVNLDSGESVDFSQIDVSQFSVVATLNGTDGDETIIGLASSDIIKGGGGDDTMEGGGGFSTFNGGAGADTFRWKAGDAARVEDFTGGEDRLAFYAADFDFNGADFDVAADDATGAADLGGADLIRYSAGTLDSPFAVSNYLFLNGSGDSGEGLFVLGSDTGGTTVLYHVSNAATGEGAVFVARFNTVAIADIQPADFAFI